MKADAIESRYGPVVVRMNSASQQDKIYEIRYKDGSWSCQCNGWRFRKTCKHVQEAERRELMEPLWQDIDDCTTAAQAYQAYVVPKPRPTTTRKRRTKPTASDPLLEKARQIVQEMLAAVGMSHWNVDAMAKVLLPHLEQPPEPQPVPTPMPQLAPNAVLTRVQRLITLED